MDHSAKPLKRADYHLEMIDGEILLYHLDETRILYCNQTASLIWYLIDGQQSIGEIIKILVDAYPDSAETIPADVEHTLGQFLHAGCINLL